MLTLTPARNLTSADLKDNLHDIQDNVVAPILMRYGRNIFVKFTDSPKARLWLRKVLKRVNARSEERGTRFTVNIGFTYEGLKVLGLSQRSLGSFPEAFRAGARGRADVVGDVGPHAPEHWEGCLGGPDIHAMGLVRTDSDQGREEATRIIRAEMEATGGVEIRFIQDTMALAHENGIGSEGEHFGFADPISQPPIELRRNGTYVVFRKLYQDAAAFRRYLATAAKTLYGSDDRYHQELVAAKMMGRWRSGCPLELSPDKDDPAIAADPQRRNNFTYAGDDQGLRCPLGSHLRRVNPRETPLKRATAVRRHRLIRRGVEYGPNLPEGVLEDDGVDRGLVQLLIQADIERQFEFVQKEWMAGGEFIGLDPNEQDPIVGTGGEGSQMVVPGAKRPFLFDLPTFVTVKGGEYLFVPGLSALEGLIEQKF